MEEARGVKENRREKGGVAWLQVNLNTNTILSYGTRFYKMVEIGREGRFKQGLVDGYRIRRAVPSRPDVTSTQYKARRRSHQEVLVGDELPEHTCVCSMGACAEAVRQLCWSFHRWIDGDFEMDASSPSGHAGQVPVSGCGFADVS
jgi:hypothetical protein